MISIPDHGLLLKELDRTGEISLSRFYFRRTLRIFPAFYFYLAVMLVLSASSLNHLTLFGALPALTYTSNYWSEWDAAGYVTSHTWSLATEEQFYLIWPLTLALAGRSRAFWIVVAAVVASPILQDYDLRPQWRTHFQFERVPFQHGPYWDGVPFGLSARAIAQL